MRQRRVSGKASRLDTTSPVASAPACGPADSAIADSADSANILPPQPQLSSEGSVELEKRRIETILRIDRSNASR
eukprot:scaffold178877_cov36-Tisochrysis_lutea.AAC.3